MSRIPRKAKTVLILGLVAVLVGAPAGAGYAAYQQDASMRGLLPHGTTIGGVDVSKLDRATAVARVRAVVERDFDRVAGITVAGHTYTTSLRQLGVHDDVDAAVARAFRTAEQGNWLTRAWHRVVDGSSAPHEDVTVTDFDPVQVAGIVHRAGTELAVPAVDAGVALDKGWLTFAKARVGKALDESAAAAAFATALKNGTTVPVDLHDVAPKQGNVDTAILVRTGENKLYLYQHGKVTKTYGVATGSPRYPTPYGRFEVVLKRFLPTWYNPHSIWSRNEPAVIPPGPRNPLGTRAMNLSAPGIRIHGTPADSSIGYSVSHGCIRMHMRDVEALYPLVPTGTPVFIVKAGPPRFRSSVAQDKTANAADGG